MGDVSFFWISMGFLGAALAGLACLAWLLFRDRKLLTSKLSHIHTELADQQYSFDAAKAAWATAPLGHVIWRKGGDIVIDATVRSWLNLPAEGLCSHTDLVSGMKPADQAEFLNAIALLERDKRSFSFIQSPASTPGIRLRWNGVSNDEVCHLWIHDISEVALPLERSANQALKTAESLAQLLEQLPYPVWRRGQELSIVWCNPSFAQIQDLSVERIISEAREINPAAKALAKRAQRVGIAQSESQQLIVKGQRRLYDLTEVPLPDGSVIGFALDQTQLEESHSELARHIAAHDDVLQALGTGIVIFGPDKRVKFFNTAFREMFNLDEGFLRLEPNVDQVLDMLRERRQIPEQADFRSFKQEWSRQVMSVIAPFEDLMHVPSGATYRMLAAPHPFGGVILTFEDVTDKLTLERSYNTLIEVQKETIDHLYEGIAVFGSDARLKLHNTAFTQLWNLEMPEVAGEPHVRQIVDAVKPFFEARPDWENLRRRIVSNIGEREVKNWRLERVDGKIIDIAAIPLADGGRLFKYADVTDSINMERALTERNEALVAADRLKSEFIANVSYEFRTPLNAIIGYAELLSRQYFGGMNERQLEYTSAILDSAQNLILMVGDVIDVAAIEAGFMHLELSQVGIRQLIESIGRLFYERARSRSIDFLIDIDSEIGEIRADPQRLKQALGNLISSAIGAAPSGRTVVVKAERQSQALNISVAVQGEANDFAVDADLDASQARSSTHGLGIALARTLIEMHGGNLLSEVGVNGRYITCSLPLEV